MLHGVTRAHTQNRSSVAASRNRLQISGKLQRRGAVLERIWHGCGGQETPQLGVVHELVVLVLIAQRGGDLEGVIAQGRSLRRNGVHRLRSLGLLSSSLIPGR